MWYLKNCIRPKSSRCFRSRVCVTSYFNFFFFLPTTVFRLQRFVTYGGQRSGRFQVYASDLLEVGGQRLGRVEVEMRVEEHQGHVAEHGLGVRQPRRGRPEVPVADGRGRAVHVLEVRVHGNVVDEVPEALRERLGPRVRRVERGHARRHGRAVERVLVPRQHLAGHDGHVRHAQVTGRVQVAPGPQQLGDDQVEAARGERAQQLRVLERGAARVLMGRVQELQALVDRLVHSDHLNTVGRRETTNRTIVNNTVIV